MSSSGRVRETPPRSSSRRHHPWNSVSKSRDRGDLSWDANSSFSSSTTDSSIFKGAEILRSQIKQSRSAAANNEQTDKILRGAAAVKAQLLARRRQSTESPAAADDDWSDPWDDIRSRATSTVGQESGVGSRQSTPSCNSSASGFSSPSFGDSPEHAYESFEEVSGAIYSTPVKEFENSIIEEEEEPEEWDESCPSPLVDVAKGLAVSDGAAVVSYEETDDWHDEQEDEQDPSWPKEEDEEDDDSFKEDYRGLDLFVDEDLDKPLQHTSGSVGFPVVMREEAPEWTDSSATASTEPPPPPTRDPEESPPLPPPDDADTPVTLMGRGNSLRLKIVTYNVQRTDEITDSDTYSTNDTYSNDTTSTPNDTDTIDDLVYSMSVEGSASKDSIERLRNDGRLGIDTRRWSAETNSSEYRFEEANDPDTSSRSSTSSYLPGKYAELSSQRISLSENHCPLVVDEYDERNEAVLPKPPSSYLPGKYSAVSSPSQSLSESSGFAADDEFTYDNSSSGASPTSIMSRKGLSPMSICFSKLMRDPAYRHAQRAGTLWQTLVAQHVRFPGHWWDGERSPQMGMQEDFFGNGKSYCHWRYISRNRVPCGPMLKKRVRNRASPGRILLHVVIRDLMTFLPVQDIAIGCFHPNARGIRRTENPDPRDEEFREVWMAVRKRAADGAVSAVDRYLTRGRSVEDLSQDSPLGGKPRISNQNMRAVFGERPPVQTIFMLESDLYERMTIAEEERPDSVKTPALLLLEELVWNV